MCMKPSALSAMQSQLWLTLLDRCCRNHGISFDQVAESALLNVSALSAMPAASITLPQLDRLLVVMDQYMAARGLGIFALGLVADFENALAIGSVIRAKATLLSACEFLVDYMHHVHPGYRMQLRHHDDASSTVSISIEHVLPCAHHCHEQLMLALLVKLMQLFSGSDTGRLHALQVSPDMLARFPGMTDMGVPLVVDEAKAGMRLDSVILRRRAPYHSSGMEVVLQNILDVTLQNDCTVVRQSSLVMDQLLAHIEAGKEASLTAIAGTLACKPRTLQHHLGQEGISFNHLRGQAQAHVARRLISEGRSTDEIVESLGFSSRSAFHHAFTRITGLRPSQVRRGEPQFVAGRDASAPPPKTL